MATFKALKFRMNLVKSVRNFTQAIKVIAMIAVISLCSPAVAGPSENKANALAFYDALIVKKKGAKAAGVYLAAEFRSHSPFLKERGAAAFLKPAEEAATEPNSEIAQWNMRVLRAVADGDTVVLHSRADVKGAIYGVIDIMRFDADGKIIEHWDYFQDVTKATNADGAF